MIQKKIATSNSGTPKSTGDFFSCNGVEEAGSALQTIAESQKNQNKVLQGLIEVNLQQDKTLQGIAEPNITTWIGTATNLVIAILAIYAAIKVKNVFDDNIDGKAYAESEKFWIHCDETIQHIQMYDYFLPFKLSESIEEWNNNEEVKEKVKKFLDFSADQQQKMQIFLHNISNLKRKINRLGWSIHPKALRDFNSLHDLIEKMYQNLGEYNCLTAQLFRIDKQFIGSTMFLGWENLAWNERFAVIDKNLSHRIAEIKIIKNEITICIKKLEDISAKRKFLSKK